MLLRNKPKLPGRNPRKGRRTPLTYYRSAAPDKSSPFEKKKPPRRRQLFGKTVDYLILIAIAAGIGYSLILGSNPQTSADSDAYHQQKTYSHAASQAFDALKNRNKITFDENSVRQELTQRFPEIADVAVDLPLVGHTATVRIKIAEPRFVLNSSGKQFVIGSGGVAITADSGIKESVLKNLPVVEDQTGFEARAGDRILSSTEVSFIHTVLMQAKHAKVPVKALTLLPQAQEMRLTTQDEDYYVRFFMNGDGLVQSGQFLAARRQFDRTNSHPKSYLDVRVQGKIYYK